MNVFASAFVKTGSITYARSWMLCMLGDRQIESIFAAEWGRQGACMAGSRQGTEDGLEAGPGPQQQAGGIARRLSLTGHCGCDF